MERRDDSDNNGESHAGGAQHDGGAPDRRQHERRSLRRQVWSAGLSLVMVGGLGLMVALRALAIPAVPDEAALSISLWRVNGDGADTGPPDLNDGSPRVAVVVSEGGVELFNVGGLERYREEIDTPSGRYAFETARSTDAGPIFVKISGSPPAVSNASLSSGATACRSIDGKIAGFLISGPEFSEPDQGPADFSNISFGSGKSVTKAGGRTRFKTPGIDAGSDLDAGSINCGQGFGQTGIEKARKLSVSMYVDLDHCSIDRVEPAFGGWYNNGYRVCKNDQEYVRAENVSRDGWEVWGSTVRWHQNVTSDEDLEDIWGGFVNVNQESQNQLLLVGASALIGAAMASAGPLLVALVLLGNDARQALTARLAVGRRAAHSSDETD